MHKTSVSSRFLRVGCTARFLTSLSSLKSRVLQSGLAICLLVVISPVPALAQESNPQSAVDSLMRSSLHVDPASGAMQMQIPLGEYRGRGGASLPIVLNYSSKLWNIKYFQTYPCSGEPITTFQAEYSKGSASGWTSSLGWFLPQEDLSLEIYDHLTQKPADRGNFQIARKYLRLPDGSRHELRLDDSLHATGSNMQGMYYAVDGSRIKYDSVADVLYLPDGSRYVNAKQLNGAIQYIDRNGNTLTYNSGVWNDALGRSISSPIPGAAPGVSQVPYAIPGFNNTTINYTLVWENLGNVLTDPNEQLHYKGDSLSPATCQTGNHQADALFHTVEDQKMILQGEIFNPRVLHQIVLPNGRSYKFTYNNYGEINKIEYPTGGIETFTYEEKTPLGGQLDDGTTDQANRGIATRTVSDGVNPSQTWIYADESTPGVDAATMARSVLSPPSADGKSTKTVTWYYRSRGVNIKYGFDDARTGMAREEIIYEVNGSTHTPLRRTIYQLAQDGPQAGQAGAGYITATRNARVTKKIDIIFDTGGDALVSATELTYDADLNVITTKRSGYYSVPQSTASTQDITAMWRDDQWKRIEETTFLVNDPNIPENIRSAYRERNLVSLPTSSRVKDGNGNIVAQSSIAYDETPLQSIGSTAGWIDPQSSYRGNVTSTGSWLNTTNSYIATHATYDQFGNVRTTTDAKGNQSHIDYSSTYNYAYATTATTAVPDPTGQHGSATAFVTISVFDPSTGLVTSTTDPNNVTTTFDYTDSLNRLKRTVRASGSAKASQTLVTYNDAARTITTESDQYGFDDKLLKSEVVCDKLGRKIESRQYESAGNYIAVRQEYDSLGRAYKTSNPFRPLAPHNEGPVWTTSAFDPLGRVVSITTETDNAVVATSYSGNRVLVKDQAGKRRISQTDGLGRLTDVWEVTTHADAEPISFPNTDVTAGYHTSYSYDALDNLVAVNQGTQPPRTFVYDSLKRLTSASNPESGTVSYQYDNNGNLTQKTDPRLLADNQTHVAITYVYDALNRVKTRTYNDGTPGVSYIYDTLPFGKGRLSSTGSSVSSYAFAEYDELGNAGRATQSIGSQSYTLQYEYNLAGQVTKLTYPSGNFVNYHYDRAGRLADKDATHLAFTGNLGDGNTRTYSSGTSYSPFGGLSKERFGTDTPIYHKRHYNMRGQLYDVRASTINDDGDWNRGAIVNYYSLANYGYGYSGTDNNGNLYVQQQWIPNGSGGYAMRQQNFSYDNLNRLDWMGEYQDGATLTGSQSYTYDRYGNKRTSGSWNFAYKDFAVDPNTNRLGVPQGQSGAMNYDAAGNLTTDTYSANAVTRTYDGENRMIAELQPNNYPAGSYAYDGDGRRIKRTVGATETWQVYGIGGELLAEYAANAAATNPQKEYGYRNGELLITAEGAVTPPVGSTPNAATFVSQQAPAEMIAGHRYAVSVTFRNSGSNTWTSANHYNLGVANDNGTWSVWRVALPGAVSPNQEVTFNFTVTAPATPANYNFQWRMVQDYVEWFGDYSTTIPVAITGATPTGENAAQCVWQSVPSTMVAGQSYTLSVRMLNTGTYTWNTPQNYRLGSANDNGAWGLYRVALPAETASNQEATFTFTVTAPATPGSYTFQWRMVQDGFEWFGDPTTAVTVNVTAAASVGKVNWLVTDHLGTPRMIFDQTGSLANMSRHDYLPFGEELFEGTGGRTTAQGYPDIVGNNVRQKFTSKERDTETGLDYFLARYYSSTQGRFASADSPLIDQLPPTPQSWNLYTYARNNPLRVTDPTGNAAVNTDEKFWERLSNWEFGFLTNAEVKSLVYYWRLWLYEREFQYGALVNCVDGNCSVINIAELDNYGVLRYAARLKEAIESNQLRYYSGDEIDLITASNLPSGGLSRLVQHSVDKINRTIRDHLSERDIQGLTRDVSRNPVRKPSGGNWDHYKETTEAVTGLKSNIRKLQKALENPKLDPQARSEVQQVIQKAQSYVSRVEKIIRSH